MALNHGYVITGGPGSGKTSLIEALAANGCAVFEEVSRRIIRQQAQLPNGVLPWHNLLQFATLALEAMQQQYNQATQLQHPVFFDRAIPDIAGYIACAQLPSSSNIRQALETCIYASPVFICPPWPDIYINDPERPQTYEDAVNLYNHIKHAYRQVGYNVIEVPKTPVAARVTFILNTIAHTTGKLLAANQSVSGTVL